MSKVICQNCFHILADRRKEGIAFDPNKVDSIFQELDRDHTLITLQCPECGCTVQVKT